MLILANYEVVDEGIPFSKQATYFTSSAVRPYVGKDNKIHIYNGSGAHRSWGAPKVTSTVHNLGGNVVGVDVTGWHKHTVGPVGGWYYFVADARGNWRRTTANNKQVKTVLA